MCAFAACAPAIVEPDDEDEVAIKMRSAACLAPRTSSQRAPGSPTRCARRGARVTAAPNGQPARKFALYDDESLVGRRSSGVAQTVGLDGDDSLSSRHLLFLRQRGGYVVRLFDNTNGATHNGAELIAGVERPLAVGDRISLGAFTVIRVIALRA